MPSPDISIGRPSLILPTEMIKAIVPNNGRFENGLIISVGSEQQRFEFYRVMSNEIDRPYPGRMIVELKPEMVLWEAPANAMIETVGGYFKLVSNIKEGDHFRFKVEETVWIGELYEIESRRHVRGRVAPLERSINDRPSALYTVGDITTRRLKFTPLKDILGEGWGTLTDHMLKMADQEVQLIHFPEGEDEGA